MDKKKYEKAEIIINKFSAKDVIFASTIFIPEYTQEEDDMEIMPVI